MDCKQTITEEDVEAAIGNIETMKIGKKTTLALITLKNGFEIIGTSACVNPENYNEEIGSKFAIQRAKDQLWAHLGFMLQMEGQISDEQNAPSVA